MYNQKYLISQPNMTILSNNVPK
ncbi:uncharacterized protein METZ01_LOCUS42087 [marine metagenome]|uniref:Uncharacterized protein n=1 Tax=marine metagenome TaxID=408172 RepID=A0A381RJI1_9ZZZZ